MLIDKYYTKIFQTFEEQLPTSKPADSTKAKTKKKYAKKLPRK